MQRIKETACDLCVSWSAGLGLAYVLFNIGIPQGVILVLLPAATHFATRHFMKHYKPSFLAA